METSLLTTKLNIPPKRPQLISRLRLSEKLQEGLKYSLILVSAPAGFGKTTFLSEWVRENKRQFSAWLSLDEGDNDPARFWNYFVAALQIIQPTCGEKILPLLRSPQPPVAELMMTELINDLSRLSSDCIIVLDDYHLIENQQIHEGITFFIEHIPSHIHLVIASRTDPPLPLPNYRGKGIMLVIDADSLRFNMNEATLLFEELKIPTLHTEDITALTERTEGWAVGLKMAAISLEGQKDISRFITEFTGSQRYVMDYLMEQVLQKQTNEICEFLCKTSVLKRLTAPLCDVVVEKEGSQDILLELERNHLFIVPLDEERVWYRYEHLFSDLLQHQCQVTYGIEHITELHKKASQWYVDNSLPDDAIHHSLSAEDWDLAIRLVSKECEGIRKRGEVQTLLNWFQAIPEEVLSGNHSVYSQYAAALAIAGRGDEAKIVFNYLEGVTQNTPALQGEIATTLAAIASRQGDITNTINMAEKALSLLPLDNITMRCRAKWSLGYVKYHCGQFNEAEQYLIEVLTMAQQVGEHFMVAASLNALGTIKHYRGQLSQAGTQFKKSIELAEQSQGLSGLQCRLCKVQYELNELDMAMENAKKSTEWFELGGDANASVVAYFYQSLIYLAQVNITQADLAIQGMDQANNHPTVGAHYHARHAANRVMFAIRRHILNTAIQWGKRLNEYSDILHLEFQHIPARLLIFQGKKEEAAKYLRDLHERMIQAGAHGLDIAVRICQALASDTEEVALEFLTDALEKGEPEGYIRTFVDEGKLLKPLLEKALSKGITPEYTKKLINIIDTEERQRRVKHKKEASSTQDKAILSEREIEVLRLIAEGITNQQIADRLIISLGTAKNHVHNIIEKLNAEGRTQAVSIARELELI